MKNKCLVSFACCLMAFVASPVTPPSAFAQSIETGTLGAAQDFDAGVIDFGSGGLDPALWQGTSANVAKTLLERAPVQSDNPLIRNMIRTVILSSGVPPQGDAAEYSRARLRVIMALDDPEAMEGVAKRSPELTADPLVRADLALASGDVPAACTMADSVTEGRGTPQWARLRSFCHAVRGEVAAAELTANLLKKSGYEDDLFFGLLNRITGASSKALPNALGSDPLYTAMAEAYLSSQESEDRLPLTSTSAARLAMDAEVSKDVRLAAIFKAGARLSDGEIESLMNGLIYDGVAVDDLDAASAFDFESAQSDTSALGFAQLFALSKRGSVEAVIALLSRAKDNGVMGRFGDALSNEIALMADSDKAAKGLSVFANLAVKRDDITALQALFGAMEEGHNRSRIAFAADAIGNGFRLGNLGQDMEARLGDDGLEGRRAVRDALLALALGSTLSDSEGAALERTKVTTGRRVAAGDLAVLRAAAKASSRAETTLRAAEILEGQRLDAVSFASVVESLMLARLSDFAGQIAAQDFLKGLE